MTEGQETAASATNVATSIKFPPTKGHYRKPITSVSLSLACLKPLPHPRHLAALANTYLHPSDKNLAHKHRGCSGQSGALCIEERAHRQALKQETQPAQKKRKTLQRDRGETKKIRLLGYLSR